MDKTVLQKDQRNLALQSLIQLVQGVDTNWKPDLVCISGDIGWFALEEDYKKAAVWFKDELLPGLNLNASDLFFAPGNHDSFRKLACEISRPTRRSSNRAKKADDILQLPLSTEVVAPFEEYSEFCSLLGVPKYRLGDEENYLCGNRVHKGLNIVSLNSAWFCQNDSDQGKLWLGMPHLYHMASKGQIPGLANISDFVEPIVAIFHHPRGWFALEEEMGIGGRPNTFDYLARRCDIILTGHTHGEVRYSDRFAERAYHLSGGATYAAPNYHNSVRLIRIEDNSADYKSYEFDPATPDSHWTLKKSGGPLILDRKLREPPINGYTCKFSFGKDWSDEESFNSIRPWLESLAMACELEYKEISSDSHTINVVLVGDGVDVTATVQMSPGDESQTSGLTLQTKDFATFDDLIANAKRPARNLEFVLQDRLDLDKFNDQAREATGSTYVNASHQENGGPIIATRLQTSIGLVQGCVVVAKIEQRHEATVVCVDLSGPPKLGLQMAHRSLTPGVILSIFSGQLSPVTKRNLLLSTLGRS